MAIMGTDKVYYTPCPDKGEVCVECRQPLNNHWTAIPTLTGQGVAYYVFHHYPACPPPPPDAPSSNALAPSSNYNVDEGWE